jgi:putative DNA primase/helicase
MKVNQCGAREAAELVAEAMALPMPEPKPAREKPQTDIAGKVAALAAKSSPGQSAYLTSKGLQCPFPMLSDGSLLLVLKNGAGATTGAQVIKPDGSKRLVAGTVKKGSFCVVNSGETPETVIIAEGLATALSVQQFRPDATIITAIDAGNLLSVAQVMRQRYPDAQIIIAADNDIKPGEPNTGKSAAEKTAKAVSGWVALPQSEEKADWNDFHQQHGLEAAAAAFNDSMYQPEGEKVVVKLKSIDGGKKEQKSALQGDELKPRVESRNDGLYWITPKVDKDSGEIINNEAWLCSPLEVVGSGSDGAERYLVLRWRSPRGHEDITRAIPCADVGEREGWRSLKAGGVNVTTKNTFRAILADWLQQCGSGQEWIITHTTGWHNGAYIMPDGEVIGDPETPILFNGRSAASSGYAVSGTAEGWRDSVAYLAGGNPSMMLGVAAALSAPLIGLVGADGFGVHLFEQSSAGKTTTANIASSLWGEPDALRLTWYGTALGIANEAEAHNDSLLPLDEVGQGSGAKDVATSAYTLFNGAGKLQGAKEGGNRELKRWRTVAISTGEMDIETFLSAGGLKVKAGQLVRLLNIPMEKSTAFHGLQNGKAHADALKQAWIENHGAAGREWVKWLAAHQKEAKQAVHDAQTRWRGLIPADYGEQVHRVAERFAILEAALVTGASITGWDEQASRDAIQHSFNAWVKEFGTGNKEHQQIIEQCEAFLNAYGLSRFAPLPYDPASLPISNLAGYRKRKSNHDDAPMVFYTFPATFEKEIAQGFNARQFARALAAAGLLSEPSSGRGYQQKSPRIDGRQINVYVLQQVAEEGAE